MPQTSLTSKSVLCYVDRGAHALFYGPQLMAQDLCCPCNGRAHMEVPARLAAQFIVSARCCAAHIIMSELHT
jgi:hypothetical protein